MRQPPKREQDGAVVIHRPAGSTPFDHARADAPLRFHLRLPAHPISVSLARNLARMLQAWTGTESMLRLELIVSEIVTNAIRYGAAEPDGRSGTIEVELIVTADAIHGCVQDSGPGFRVPTSRPRAEQTGGFGWLIARDLATDLALERTTTGNLVRFSVPVGA